MGHGMHRHFGQAHHPTAATAAILAILALVIALLVPALGRATEIVPSYGLTKSVDGDEVKGVFGLALRGTLIPNLLQTEIAGSYRTEDAGDGALHVRQWPIMASVLLTPLNLIHADAGVGWYHTTYDYEDELLDDETDQSFGVHLGGGLKVPVAPRVALDLTGRYVMMRDQDTKLIPESFNPDFWTLSAGLALKF
jgi:opacity protein-like surface antigen